MSHAPASPIMELLFSFVRGGGESFQNPAPEDAEDAIEIRTEIAAQIDRLHRDGGDWPYLRDYERRGIPGPLSVIPMGLALEPTPRPERGYCVRWNGAFWVPCGHSPKRRRAAGYLPLMMCWPPPLPKASHILVTGPRSRLAYVVREVERFDKPRTAKRYTCRLWCDRLLPVDIPRDAIVHYFHWHPRGRASRAA